jgi:hypothetical protein
MLSIADAGLVQTSLHMHVSNLTDNPIPEYVIIPVPLFSLHFLLFQWRHSSRDRRVTTSKLYTLTTVNHCLQTEVSVTLATEFQANPRARLFWGCHCISKEILKNSEKV